MPLRFGTAAVARVGQLGGMTWYMFCSMSFVVRMDFADDGGGCGDGDDDDNDDDSHVLTVLSCTVYCYCVNYDD